MKFFVALTWLVAGASAGLVLNLPSLTNLREKLPMVPLMPLQELEGRITNGELAAVGQFPYQVGLAVLFGPRISWCGGTLISNRWLVTAAHCVNGTDGVVVYLGATDIHNINEKSQQRLFCTKEYITMHEEYNKELNDIALIKLPVPIDFNDYVQPATLPKKSDNYSTYENATVVASGWGKDSDSAKTITQFLRFVEITVLKQSICNMYYFGGITSNMICIDTKGGKSICNGDSGGPLVYKDGNTNYLIGTTSFGIKFGCEIGYPAVFTRITAYLGWIEEKTGVVNL